MQQSQLQIPESLAIQSEAQTHDRWELDYVEHQRHPLKCGFRFQHLPACASKVEFARHVIDVCQRAMGCSRMNGSGFRVYISWKIIPPQRWRCPSVPWTAPT